MNNNQSAMPCKCCNSIPEIEPDMGAYIPGGKVYFGCTTCKAMVGIDLREPEHQDILATKDAEEIKNNALTLLTAKWNQFFAIDPIKG